MPIKVPKLTQGAGSVFLMIALASCQPRVEPVQPQLQGEVPSPDSLLKQLSQRRNSITDVKSFVRTTISGEKFRHSFKQTLILRGQESIRLDTYGMFGQALGVFIHNGEETLLYDPGNNRVIQGFEVWDAMERMLGIDMSIIEYIGIFSGNIAYIENFILRDTILSRDQKIYYLKGYDPVRRERVDLEIDTGNSLPVKMAVSANGKTDFIVSWDDYRKVDQWDFPHKIIISFPNRGEILKVKYSDPKINEGIPREAFEIVPTKTSITVNE